MERVVVTGAAGNIGREVCRRLRADGVAVTGVVLDDPGDLGIDRVVVGDVADLDLMRDACRGADGLVHLAAIPSPVQDAADEVFCGNVSATFCALEAAGEAGVRRAVIASSINALGLRFSVQDDAAPAYLPWDEQVPTQACDPYSMSKWADEATAAAMARRHGLSVVCLRFPLVTHFDTALPPAEALSAFGDVADGARDLWLYLEVHDAAKAVEAALEVREPGAHVAFVTAPTTYAPHPTEQLLDRYWPGVERRRGFAGNEVPVDLTEARTLLGFTAERVFDLTLTDLP